MAYQLRDRKLLKTRGTYLETTGPDDESHDSSHSDPDYGKPPRRPKRRSRNNVRPSAAMWRSGGFRIADSGGASSSRNAAGTVVRRRSGGPPKTWANGEVHRQGSTERSRRKKRTNFSQVPEEITKRTVLSWLISLRVVKENEVVWYVEAESGNILSEGIVNRAGILCSCCSCWITVEEFEIHAGSETGKPYQHIYLAMSQLSLLDCQIEAWEGWEEKGKRTDNKIQPETLADDKNDDACIVCGDGGDLICCEKCPSTFHPKCIFMETIPQGDWLCAYCVCKFCANADGLLEKCTQCEKQYHSKCGGEQLDLMNSSAFLFCGSSCRKIYEGLQSMIGVGNDLQDGLSWTLLKRTEQPFGSSADDLYSNVQRNSKIAVAWMVMSECFMPTIDRHTGADITQSIIYNRGSNVTRVNYSGFYTAILEKNDEIVCVASIRVHGKNLAEMPLIGTHGGHRRLGMARILESCVESTLYALNVEKLVIPSLDQVVDMWIQKYFFCHIEEDWLKKELSQYNTVMFPSPVVKLLKNLAMLPDMNMVPQENQ